MGVVDRIGQVLVETYRIDRLIAEGGMGSVYEAKHLRLPKRFAVKFLNVSLIDNHEAQVRFRREAEIIAALDHPNIVNLLDYNVTEEGVPFIVLEYLDGEHLGKRIGRGKLSLAETMRVLAPVCSALTAAHALEIVHRDLKPENIVLCKDDVVKVVDFGIAKIRDGQELTGINTILGTIPYMAPEQLFGTAVSIRTDQFALGAIVYEMLTAEMAFGGPASVPEVAARVAHHQPPDVPGVPQAVSAAIFQAMAKDAAARYSSVKEFLAAMHEAALKPDEAPVVIDGGAGSVGAIDEGLPELQGEATMINPVVPTAAERGKRGSIGDETGASRLPEHGGAESSPAFATAVIDRSALSPASHRETSPASHHEPAAASAMASDETGSLAPAYGNPSLPGGSFSDDTREHREAANHFATPQDDRGGVAPEYTARVTNPGPESREARPGHFAPTVLSQTISDQPPARADATMPVRDSHSTDTTSMKKIAVPPSRTLNAAIGALIAVVFGVLAWFVLLRKH